METSKDSCSICSETVRVQKKVRDSESAMGSDGPSAVDSRRELAGMRANSRGKVGAPDARILAWSWEVVWRSGKGEN